MNIENLPLSIGDFFEEKAHDYKDLTAIYIDNKHKYTYQYFDESINKVVNFLINNGITNKDIVCIDLEKCLASYCLIFASLKIGAPYFFLDPKSPPIRTKKILEKTKPSIIFTSENSKFNQMKLNSLIIEDDGQCLNFCKKSSKLKTWKNFKGGGLDVAYIIFTSGSTGEPKGVMISHENLKYFINWAKGCYDFVPGEKHSHLNPIYFDNSVFDIYSTFFSGGVLVPFSLDLIKNPIEVVKKIDNVGCNILFSVPSLFIYLETAGTLGPEKFKSVKKIIFGGEGYPKTQLYKIYKMYEQHCNFYNVYGPSECTCICSSKKIENSDFENLLGYAKIGKLNKLFKGVLLDIDGNLIPSGDVGELYLSGKCIGLGYIGEVELTREKFKILNNQEGQELYYQTGDLFRQDAMGDLWFIGRADFQVKHQGYRIELEEIENALMLINGVNQACVVQVNLDEIGSLLVAILSISTGGVLSSKTIKESLEQYLPRYMIPNKIIFLNELPKNTSGKIDKKALKYLASQKFGEAIE